MRETEEQLMQTTPYKPDDPQRLFHSPEKTLRSGLREFMECPFRQVPRSRMIKEVRDGGRLLGHFELETIAALAEFANIPLSNELSIEELEAHVFYMLGIEINTTDRLN